MPPAAQEGASNAVAVAASLGMRVGAMGAQVSSLKAEMLAEVRGLAGDWEEEDEGGAIRCAGLRAKVAALLEECQKLNTDVVQSCCVPGVAPLVDPAEDCLGKAMGMAEGAGIFTRDDAIISPLDNLEASGEVGRGGRRGRADPCSDDAQEKAARRSNALASLAKKAAQLVNLNCGVTHVMMFAVHEDFNTWGYGSAAEGSADGLGQDPATKQMLMNQLGMHPGADTAHNLVDCGVRRKKVRRTAAGKENQGAA